MQTAGDREDGATSSAGAVCETAAGSGRASRPTVGEERSAKLASSGRRGCAPDGEAGASGQTGDTEHGPSRQSAREPADCWPPRTALIHAAYQSAGAESPACGTAEQPARNHAA